MAMDVLENEHPAYRVLDSRCQPHQRIAQQSFCEGYTVALANLRALRILNKKMETLEPTFEPEQKEE